VQDPAEATYPELPLNALRFGPVDYCLTIDEIAQRIVRLTQEPLPEQPLPPGKSAAKLETEFAMGRGNLDSMNELGTPSNFSCPSCGGPLWQIREGDNTRFRCHVGHAFQVPSLLVEQSRAIETSLEAAQRALEEKAAVLQRLSAGRLGQRSAEGFAERAREADTAARAVRDLIQSLRE